MHSPSEKQQDNKTQAVAHTMVQKPLHSEAATGKMPPSSLQEMVDNSPKVKQFKAYQQWANQSAQARQSAQLKAMVSHPPGQQHVVQRAVKDMAVTGITHLVSLNQEGSLYQKDFRGNEEQEVEEGHVLEIETSGAMRSRRGPNQEAFHTEDESGPSWYVWYPVLSLNNRAVNPNTYIREDTFRELNEHEELKSKQEDRYQYVADFAKSRKGKHWWASFNEQDGKRDIGENVINAFAAKNIKKVDDKDTLISNLVEAERTESLKKTLTLNNRLLAQELQKDGGFKTKPNVFIKSLLEEDPENNHYKEALDRDPDEEDTIMNCEEFAMYVLVQSGFMTRLELSSLLKKAQMDQRLEVVYSAMGFNDAQALPEKDSPKTGIIFEMRESTITHVVFCAGSEVVHLAFGNTLSEWRAKVENTNIYLENVRKKNTPIRYSPLSRRHVESALTSIQSGK